MENEDKEKASKIIITVSVIIIFALVIGVIIFIVAYTNEQLKYKRLNETKNEVINQVNDDNSFRIENVTNEKIINNSNETFDRSFGKVDIVWVDKANNIIQYPLKPALKNMTPVKFNQSTLSFVKTTENDKDWYDYSKRMWANAIDESLSYFVWIPRYAYKITYYSDSNFTKAIGYSDSRGILKINTDGTLTRIQSRASGLKEIGNHYILAPAFMKDTASGFNNGGWDVNISGIWCSKYEMSLEVNSSHIDTESQAIGDVITSNIVRAVSRPAVSSWRNISIGKAYYNSYNYNRDLESHMMKNSEWGAVSYLAYSIYGRNTYKITNNTSHDYLTGGTKVETDVYNTYSSESTTGNATGVYDLSGNAWEFVSTFINNGYARLQEYGGTEEGYLLQNASSNKYKTVYSKSSTDKGKGNYDNTHAIANYNANMTRRGDAMYETSLSGYGSTAWNVNSSFYIQLDIPFLIRGGDFASQTSAGLFSYNGTSGQANASDSFRVMLVGD